MASAPNPANGTDVNLWSVVIAAGSFALNFVIACGTAIWALGRSKIATDDKITDNDKDTRQFIATMERNLNSELDGVRRDAGESDRALRAHVNSMELWVRDNLVSKEAFKDMQETVRDMRKHIDGRFDRLEEKLEMKSGG